MFDFSIVTTWFDSLLRQTLGLGDFLSILIECVVVGVLILTAYALIAIALIFMERKVCAYFQCRLGPMRVGPWGIFQVFADVVKMLIKEIFAVDKADKFLYYLAPFLVIIASVGTFSFLPWNKGAGILDFNVGVFLITAISSIGVLGIFIAGWGSNNKYSVVSAMRGAVQMISYELSLGLCLIAAVALTGTMQVSSIVAEQTGPWNWLIVKGHIPAIIAFLVFLVAGNAEANRGPFDMAEAESELTAGYHTEYSGMGFGFYYLAEYLNLFVIAGIASTVFLGGWAPLNIGVAAFDTVMNYIPGFVWFFGKTFAVVWLLMWIRWTFPRLRIDQILKLEWKYLMPLSLLNLVLMTVCVALGWYVK
ncbi:NADH:ubiquinone oxidoreductase subunit 1 (chain H) [Prevotella dentalis DSM 3688]|uniref:NADH-quinone oxidoreductase subunit H n=1 Tax=Prevotella dentalis (strain ATCC 49559 / DSM 3688 / JCM 13448 / NCTC 12043 / ES 2772) TaxID=908937 RepID=F9D5G9_PREDD|nr:NADH-quinone oxidoreductase subunit NuoH [Prevotella dentalis]AGB29202.1 NADH:ubiquinone oxidoreductase subunit 1 (chain H) [Prevotella dentalis DSM 3688]EGQ13121.1 NADH-quinone oxidoreductase subunit H [Prevotella dentalis DSM 3688]